MSTIHTTLRLPTTTFDWIGRRASRFGMSISQAVTFTVCQYMDAADRDEWLFTGRTRVMENTHRTVLRMGVPVHRWCEGIAADWSTTANKVIRQILEEARVAEETRIAEEAGVDRTTLSEWLRR